MPDKFTEKIPKFIPAKYLSWVFSLLGGSALVLFWTSLDQSKQIGALMPPAGSPPSVQPAVPAAERPSSPPAYRGDERSGEDDRGEREHDDGGEDDHYGSPTPVSAPFPPPAPTTAPVTPPAPSTPPSGGVVADIYRDGTYRASSGAPWGTMTVEVTVVAGKWTAIGTPSIPDSPPSYYAVTYLVQQALAAQNDRIDGVSGATYTSNAFRDDLRQIVQLSKK